MLEQENHPAMHNQVLYLGQSLTFELPIELDWFMPATIQQACEQVEHVSELAITVTPPATGKRFEVYADKPAIINQFRIVQALLGQLAITAVIRQVARGWHACGTCEDRRMPRLYTFTIKGGESMSFCPKCTSAWLKAGHVVLARMTDILVVV
jgi:hypothetical protein